MITNKAVSRDSELFAKGQALIKAAHEYWEQYQKDVGSSAVVWLEAENGHFVLFTRSEYKDEIMRSAVQETRGEKVLFTPFEPRRD